MKMRIEDFLDRASAASQGGRREEARDLLVDVLAVDPDNLEAWLRLADLAASPDRAALYYQRAVDIDPRSLRAQRGLQEAMVILGPASGPERTVQETPAPAPGRSGEPVQPQAGGRPPCTGPLQDVPIFVDDDSAPFAI